MRVSSMLLSAAAACLPAQLSAGPPACSCNGYINSAGQGECQTKYKGRRFCYVNKGSCRDEREGSSSSRVWSYKACVGYDSGPTRCHGLSGETCEFPFQYQGRTFTNCTTHDSANGAAWCATRVQGRDRKAVVGRLEDCSAPCDLGASPYEVCPRSPVVKGLSKGCCTRDRPCGLGEGDCDSDSDCRGGLQCGDSNCARFRPDNYHRADCCYDPYTKSGFGKSQCLYAGRTYEHSDTFPASDQCNDCHCEDGQVACTEMKCTEGPQDCTTVGGPDPGVHCAFPFSFDGVRYNECTVRAADDGKPWCSTKTDYSGNHISGQGHWGHCPNGGCGQGSCSWGAWGSWSSCSQVRATCEGGSQRRTRSSSGSECSGPREEVIPCNQRDCTSVWGSWGAWGACTASCGQGVQRRTRRCQQGRCPGEEAESRGCSGEECGCRSGSRRVRRNVGKLSSREQRSLVAAMEAAISRGEYARVGNFHGFPGNICGTTSSPQSCCPHGETTFLPWHRLYMVQMEEVLGQALPYWDWTEDGQVPQLWEDLRAPIREGHQSLGGRQCPPGDVTVVRRAQGISINIASLQRATKTAFLKTTFEEFSDQISAPHNELHVSVNCDMLSVETAGYDPVFYLHHAYVDRQFAFWQELQRLRGLDSPRLARHSQALRPFNSRQFNNKQKTLENNLGSDTFDYRTNYCYEYDDLTFMGMTPQEFLEENQPPSIGGSFGGSFNTTSSGECPPDDQGVCLTESSPRRPAEVYVGVVLPKKAPSGIHTFEVCLGSRCIAAGQVATFGAGSSTDSQRVDSSTHMVVEYDVTDLVESSGWSGLELSARLTSSVVAGLPGPVVIERFGGSSGGEVSLATGNTLVDYGNLLEKYDIVSDMAS